MILYLVCLIILFKHNYPYFLQRCVGVLLLGICSAFLLTYMDRRNKTEEALLIKDLYQCN